MLKRSWFRWFKARGKDPGLRAQDVDLEGQYGDWISIDDFEGLRIQVFHAVGLGYEV